jgi:hypothetical protein
MKKGTNKIGKNRDELDEFRADFNFNFDDDGIKEKKILKKTNKRIEKENITDEEEDQMKEFTKVRHCFFD